MLVQLHVKGDAHWMAEYKKLERRTRLQLQAKEREITRLRRVIQQCETEHSANLQRLLSEMRCQVENLSKWIENKGETFPLSSSLVNMALSHRDDIDIFSGTGESSSNQSSLERPPKRLHKRKMPLEGHSPRSTGPSAMNSTVAASTDHPGDVSGPPILQHFSANISNPPSAVESDTLDISRVPVQVTDFTADLSRQPDLGNNEEYPTRLVLQNDSNTKCDQPVPVSTTTVFNTSVNPPISAGKFPTGAAPSCSLWKSRETAALPTIDESHTPSTVKSNTTSPTLSPQGDINTPKSSKGFKFAKDIISPKSYKVDQESTADFRAVFRKIRGKDPPTK